MHVSKLLFGPLCLFTSTFACVQTSLWSPLFIYIYFCMCPNFSLVPFVYLHLLMHVSKLLFGPLCLFTSTYACVQTSLWSPLFIYIYFCMCPNFSLVPFVYLHLLMHVSKLLFGPLCLFTSTFACVQTSLWSPLFIYIYFCMCPNFSLVPFVYLHLLLHVSKLLFGPLCLFTSTYACVQTSLWSPLFIYIYLCMCTNFSLVPFVYLHLLLHVSKLLFGPLCLFTSTYACVQTSLWSPLFIYIYLCMCPNFSLVPFVYLHLLMHVSKLLFGPLCLFTSTFACVQTSLWSPLFIYIYLCMCTNFSLVPFVYLHLLMHVSKLLFGPLCLFTSTFACVQTSLWSPLFIYIYFCMCPNFSLVPFVYLHLLMHVSKLLFGPLCLFTSTFACVQTSLWSPLFIYIYLCMCPNFSLVPFVYLHLLLHVSKLLFGPLCLFTSTYACVQTSLWSPLFIYIYLCMCTNFSLVPFVYLHLLLHVSKLLFGPLCLFTSTFACVQTSLWSPLFIYIYLCMCTNFSLVPFVYLHLLLHVSKLLFGPLCLFTSTYACVQTSLWSPLFIYIYLCMCPNFSLVPFVYLHTYYFCMCPNFSLVPFVYLHLLLHVSKLLFGPLCLFTSTYACVQTSLWSPLFIYIYFCMCPNFSLVPFVYLHLLLHVSKLLFGPLCLFTSTYACVQTSLWSPLFIYIYLCMCPNFSLVPFVYLHLLLHVYKLLFGPLCLFTSTYACVQTSLWSPVYLHLLLHVSKLLFGPLCLFTSTYACVQTSLWSPLFIYIYFCMCPNFSLVPFVYLHLLMHVYKLLFGPLCLFTSTFACVQTSLWSPLFIYIYLCMCPNFSLVPFVYLHLLLHVSKLLFGPLCLFTSTYACVQTSLWSPLFIYIYFCMCPNFSLVPFVYLHLLLHVYKLLFGPLCLFTSTYACVQTSLWSPLFIYIYFCMCPNFSLVPFVYLHLLMHVYKLLFGPLCLFTSTFACVQTSLWSPLFIYIYFCMCPNFSLVPFVYLHLLMHVSKLLFGPLCLFTSTYACVQTSLWSPLFIYIYLCMCPNFSLVPFVYLHLLMHVSKLLFGPLCLFTSTFACVQTSLWSPLFIYIYLCMCTNFSLVPFVYLHLLMHVSKLLFGPLCLFTSTYACVQTSLWSPLFIYIYLCMCTNFSLVPFVYLHLLMHVSKLLFGPLCLFTSTYACVQISLRSLFFICIYLSSIAIRFVSFTFTGVLVCIQYIFIIEKKIVRARFSFNDMTCSVVGDLRVIWFL